MKTSAKILATLKEIATSTNKVYCVAEDFSYSLYEPPTGKVKEVEKAEGTIMDNLDARAILALHDGLNAENRSKFLEMEPWLMKAMVNMALRDGVATIKRIKPGAE